MKEYTDYSNEALKRRINNIFIKAAHRGQSSDTKELSAYFFNLLGEVRDHYKKRKDDAYTERMKCVAALCAYWHNLGFKVGKDTHSGEWDEEWRTIVYANLPTGQVSWHMHDSHVELFNHIPYIDFEYDGHTTEEKYKRVREMQSYPIERKYMDGDDEGATSEEKPWLSPTVRLDQLEATIEHVASSTAEGMETIIDAYSNVKEELKELKKEIDNLDEKYEDKVGELDQGMSYVKPGIDQLEMEVKAAWEQIKLMGGGDV